MLEFKLFSEDNKKKLIKTFGDDSWFDYQFEPFSKKLNRPVKSNEDIEAWFEALRDAYLEAEHDIVIKITVDNGLPLPPEMSTPLSSSEYRSGVIKNNPSYNLHPRAQFHDQLLSGWWRRAAAYIIDIIIVLLLCFVVGFLLGFVLISQNTVSESSITLISLILGFATSVLYYALTMSRQGLRNGQTWGKQLIDIRVVREDGQAIGAGFAVLRQIFVMQFLFGFILAFFFYIPTILNYLWPLWDNKRQCLHDKIVSTRVVRT